MLNAADYCGSVALSYYCPHFSKLRRMLKTVFKYILYYYTRSVCNCTERKQHGLHIRRKARVRQGFNHSYFAQPIRCCDMHNRSCQYPMCSPLPLSLESVTNMRRLNILHIQAAAAYCRCAQHSAGYNSIRNYLVFNYIWNVYIQSAVYLYC
jgi:hypothetical protein